MAKKTTLTARERLKKLYIDFGLTREDIYTHTKFNYVMMTRTGVEKVQHQMGIVIKFDTIRCEEHWCVVLAKATLGEIEIESYGTASKQNCKIAYYAEMAQKRAKARLVLEMSGFYSVGVYSEVEADEFHHSYSKSKPQDTKLGETINEMNATTPEEIQDKMLNTMREYNGE